MTPLEFLEQQEADLVFAYETGIAFGSGSSDAEYNLAELQEQAVEDLLIEAANEIAADDEGMKTILGFYLEQKVSELGEAVGRNASDVAGEAAKKRFAWRVVATIAAFSRRLLVTVASWVLNAARTVIYSVARIAFRFLVQPLLTGIAAFLASPAGLAVAGVALAAGGGYVAYRALVKGESLGSIFGTEGEVDEPGQEQARKPTHLRHMYLTADGQLVDVPYLDNLEDIDYDRDREEARVESYGAPVSESPAMVSAPPSREQARAGADRALRASRKRKQRGEAPGKLSESALVRALDEAGITNRTERAMFLGQMAHESGGFRYNEEVWGPTATQLRYQNHRYLGNKYKGDGYKFRGRGYIQLTGRDNYQRAGRYLGLDLVGNPDLAADPDIAARIALWYWQVERPRIPALARQGKVRQVTKLINGGYNGLEDRTRRFQSYMQRLAAGELAPSNVASVDKMDVQESPTTTAQRQTRKAVEVAAAEDQYASSAVIPGREQQEPQYFKHNSMIVVA